MRSRFKQLHCCRHGALVLFAAKVLLLCLATSTSLAALHLMFPYDYLSLSQEERRLYLVGVVDARLAPLSANGRLDWLSDCVSKEGMFRLQQVIEENVIATPEIAVIPMPYVVERGIAIICESYEKTAQSRGQ